MRRMILAVLAAAVMVTAAGQAVSAATIAPVLVKGRPAIDESFAAADGTYLLWSQNSIAHPRHYDAFIEPLDQSTPPVKVNAASTQGFTGPTINGTEATFQEITKGARVTHSNIYLYDTTTDTRSNPPAGVNTKDWEWSPATSPGFILFGRNTFKTPRSPWKVMLYDRTNHTFKVLDHAKNRCQCIFPGGVTDTYATWAKCVTMCQAYYYDIAGHTTTKVPNPLNKQQYSPSPSGDSSSIYFARSGNGCGLNVKLMRYDVGGGDPVVVSSMPSTQDIFWSPSVYTDGLLSDHVYFGSITCGGNFYSDIYKVDGAETPTIAGSGTPARSGGGFARPPDPRASP